MIRKIVEIDETLCDGCGVCVPGCAEGALRVVDGKARLIGEPLCDGLGACIGRCPQGAISVVEREAEPYSESHVLETRIIPAGTETLRFHLEHLRATGATEWLEEALSYLKEKGIAVPGDSNPGENEKPACPPSGCPGSAHRQVKKEAGSVPQSVSQASELRSWPVQLHLIHPGSPNFREADLLVAADCSAFACGGFHSQYLRGRELVIACPKLDSGTEKYIEKLGQLIDESRIRTLTVLRMEVPCCGGLTALCREAISRSERKIPLNEMVINIRGRLISEKNGI